jgi:hypothetical protein
MHNILRRENQINSISFFVRRTKDSKNKSDCNIGCGLNTTPKKSILRKSLLGKDIAFRTRFGPGPSNTENQGANRE